MKTWSIKLEAIDKNGDTYEHVAVAGLSLARYFYSNLYEFMKSQTRNVLKTKANDLYKTPLVITKDRDNNTYIFEQEGSEWNFTLSERQMHVLDAQCEIFSLSNPPKGSGVHPTGKQVADYLYAIDKGDTASIDRFNTKFYG